MPKGTRKKKAVRHDKDAESKIKEDKKLFSASVMPVESSSKEDAKAGVESQRWRTNFMDAHNQDPDVLAENLYPTPLMLSEVSNKKRWQVENEGEPPETQGEQGDLDVKTLCKVLCNEFKGEMEKVGLKIDWVHSKKNMWDPYIFSGGKNKLVRAPRFQPSSRVPFFCQRCVDSKRNLGLVANGRLALDDRGGAIKSTANDKVKDEDIGRFHLHIDEIYYHSCECTEAVTSVFREYREKRAVLMPIPLPWILGTRYDDVLATLDAWDGAPPFVTSLLGKDVQERLLQERGVGVFRSNTDAKRPWTPLGLPINNGVGRYKYDDRAILPLPGHPLQKYLSVEDHRTSMARLHYLMICRLGVEKGASPFLFDEGEFRKKWQEANESMVTSNKDRKKGKEVYYTECWKKNDNHHVAMKDVSLLFGGNEREISGRGPVHQFCHVDCGVNLDSRKEDPARLLPGTFIVPLTPDGRKIYIWSPKNEIHIPMTKMLLFRGDVPHGGCTALACERAPQMAAIQGHLDSSGHTREQTLVGVDAPEHLLVSDREKIETVIETQLEDLQYSLDVLASIEDYKDLDGEKLKKMVEKKQPTFRRKGSGEQTKAHTMESTLEQMLEEANKVALGCKSDGEKQKYNRRVEVLKIRLDTQVKIRRSTRANLAKRKSENRDQSAAKRVDREGGTEPNSYIL